MLGFGSEWLRLELVRTHVEGHRMIWKVTLREGEVAAGLEDSMTVQGSLSRRQGPWFLKDRSRGAGEVGLFPEAVRTLCVSLT